MVAEPTQVELVVILQYFIKIIWAVVLGTTVLSNAAGHQLNPEDAGPVPIIFFGLLLVVSEILWLPEVFPRFSLSMKFLASVIIISPLVFLYLSSMSDPGFITKGTQDFYATHYPYDCTLFHPGNSCKTCTVMKPARSKHCSLCRHCVAKSDHHCIFINNCVGLGNLHWFLLLLGSTAILTGAGTFLGGEFILHAVIQASYPQFIVFNSGFSWAEYLTYWHWAFQESPRVGGVTLLCFCTTPLVAGLFLYNMYQIWAGYTTNEGAKWSDLKLDIADGVMYMRPLSSTRQRKYEPTTSWPREAKNVVIWREEGAPLINENLPGEGEWIQLWSISKLENIYDIGFLGNLGEVFLPRQIFEEYFCRI